MDAGSQESLVLMTKDLKERCQRYICSRTTRRNDFLGTLLLLIVESNDSNAVISLPSAAQRMVTAARGARFRMGCGCAAATSTTRSGPLPSNTDGGMGDLHGCGSDMDDHGWKEVSRRCTR